METFVKYNDKSNIVTLIQCEYSLSLHHVLLFKISQEICWAYDSKLELRIRNVKHLLIGKHTQTLIERHIN